MKVIEQNKFLYTNGLQSQNSFTIKATSKAFKILSDGLYSDKITAIIRELSCNAYDAHVAAGNKDKPFTVNLPNALDPSFKIRDYGVGLSESDLTTLYTTYFESTKTDSNDFVGALGLGSKSPFCFTDSFVVVSYFNGSKYSYTAFLDNGFPNIAKLGEEPTTEVNGIEIIIAVPEQRHFTEFASKATQVFKWFKVKPEITGNKITIPEITYEVEGKGWGLVRSSYNGNIAVQGNVAYPFSVYDLKDISKELLDMVAYNSFVLFFDIGELEVAASREKLSLDDRTIANIISKLEKVQKEIDDQANEIIKSAKTFYEAKVKLKPYERICNAISNSITFNGKSLKDTFYIDFKNFPTWNGYRYTYSRAKPNFIYNADSKSRYNQVCDFDIGSEVWIDDVGISASSRISTYKKSTDKSILLLRKPEYIKTKKPDLKSKIISNKDFKQLKVSLLGFPVNFVSSLPAAENNRVKTNREKTKWFKLDLSNLFTTSYGMKKVPISRNQHTRMANSWQNANKPTNFNKDNLYIVIDHFVPYDIGTVDQFLKKYLEAIDLKLISNDVNIYGIRVSDYKKDKTLNPEYEFAQFAKTQLSNKLKKMKIYEKVKLHDRKQRVTRAFDANYIRFIRQYKDESKLIDKLISRYDASQKYDLKAEEFRLYQSALTFNIGFGISNISEEMNLHDQIKTKYPLLAFLAEKTSSFYNYGSNLPSDAAVKEYIDLINNYKII